MSIILHEHNGSKLIGLHPTLIGKNLSGTYNCDNLIIKIIKSCDTVAVVMGIILSIIGKFLSIA